MASVNVTRNQQAAISKIPLSRFLAGEDLLCEGGLPEGGPTTVRWWIETDDPIDSYTTARLRVQELDGRAIAYGRIMPRTAGILAGVTSDSAMGGYASYGCYAAQGYVRARLMLGDTSTLGSSPSSESSNVCMTVMPGSPADFESNITLGVVVSAGDTAFDNTNAWILPPRGTNYMRAWLIDPTNPVATPPWASTPSWGLAGFGVACPFASDSTGWSYYTHGYVSPATDAQIAAIAAGLAPATSTTLYYYVAFRGKW